MEIVKSLDDARRTVRKWQREGRCVGFVPTMGALHEGHLSLVHASAAECCKTVVSVFVNPAQFGPGEDLGRYPRRLKADCRMVERAGADLVFAPDERAMYPDGFCTYVAQEKLTDKLCGALRPGHFRGVTTVVLKLFNIVPADKAYFGRKDFQQTVVIRRMVEDLNLPVEIRVMPTVREKDGLAMSSRNEYLGPDERRQAVCLYEALTGARRLFAEGETSAGRLIAAMRGVIARYPLAKPHYVEIVAPDTLEPVSRVAADSVAALAIFVGKTRLIDNMPFDECEDVFAKETLRTRRRAKT